MFEINKIDRYSLFYIIKLKQGNISAVLTNFEGGEENANDMQIYLDKKSYACLKRNKIKRKKERNLKKMLKKENEILRTYDNQKLKVDFNLIRIPVSVREVVTDNNKFCTYYTKNKNNDYFIVKFKKTNLCRPQEKGHYVLYAEYDEINFAKERKKAKDNDTIYIHDVIWVGRVEDYDIDENKIKAIKEANDKELNKFLSDDIDLDKLPF